MRRRARRGAQSRRGTALPHRADPHGGRRIPVRPHGAPHRDGRLVAPGPAAGDLRLLLRVAAARGGALSKLCHLAGRPRPARRAAGVARSARRVRHPNPGGAGGPRGARTARRRRATLVRRNYVCTKRTRAFLPHHRQHRAAGRMGAAADAADRPTRRRLRHRRLGPAGRPARRRIHGGPADQHRAGARPRHGDHHRRRIAEPAATRPQRHPRASAPGAQRDSPHHRARPVVRQPAGVRELSRRRRHAIGSRRPDRHRVHQPRIQPLPAVAAGRAGRRTQPACRIRCRRVRRRRHRQADHTAAAAVGGHGRRPGPARGGAGRARRHGACRAGAVGESGGLVRPGRRGGVAPGAVRRAGDPGPRRGRGDLRRPLDDVSRTRRGVEPPGAPAARPGSRRGRRCGAAVSPVGRGDRGDAGGLEGRGGVSADRPGAAGNPDRLHDRRRRTDRRDRHDRTAVAAGRLRPAGHRGRWHRRTGPPQRRVTGSRGRERRVRHLHVGHHRRPQRCCRHAPQRHPAAAGAARGAARGGRVVAVPLLRLRRLDPGDLGRPGRRRAAGHRARVGDPLPG
ncbi:hypothetical protein MYCO108962_26390 [Mycobacterium colombiense]